MYTVTEPSATWPELVTLAVAAHRTQAGLPHAAARDIARHRAVLPAHYTSERRYASPTMRRFLFNGEITDDRLTPIADALFDVTEVDRLTAGDRDVYTAFLWYLADRTAPFSGQPTSGPVPNWSALTLDS